MTFGIEFVNENGQILISDGLKTLHFWGKPSANLVASDSTAGGSFIYVYYVTVSSSYVPVPFFSIPNTSSQLVGNTRVSYQSSNSRWRIELLTNVQSAPQVYIFIEPNAAIVQQDYGARVFNGSGVITFDSGRLPLVIEAAFSSASWPSDPAPNADATGLSARDCGGEGSVTFSNSFTPTNTGRIVGTTTLPAKPIFLYPSTAQAQRMEAVSEQNGYCRDFGHSGLCIGTYRNEAWYSAYWAFYRGGIGRSGSSNLKTGWVTRSYDCYHDYAYRDTTSIGINVGDLFGIFNNESGTATGGTHPYTNESINLTSNPILVADGAKYD
mgnify:CR=1 FL=1